MTEKDQKLLETLLLELENTYREGKIDQNIYNDFKARYQKKLEEITKSLKIAPPIEVDFAGRRVLTEDTMIVRGSASIVGGNLKKNLIIEGSSRIAGNLHCLAIKVGGDMECAGTIEADGEINCAGTINVGGNLKGHADAIFASGAVIGGSVRVDGNLRSTGSFRSGGSLCVGGRVNAGGSLTVSGNMEVEGDVNSTGMLLCHGNLRSPGTVQFAGAVTIHGNVRGPRSFIASGKAQISGNVSGGEILVGDKEALATRLLANGKRFSIVHGNIKSFHGILLMDCEVQGNVSGESVLIGPNVVIHGNVRFVKDYQCASDAVVRGKFQQWTGAELQEAFSKEEVKTFESTAIPAQAIEKIPIATKQVPVETYDAKEAPKEPQESEKGQINQPGDLPQYCSSCGGKIKPFMRFCPVCGTTLH